MFIWIVSALCVLLVVTRTIHGQEIENETPQELEITEEVTTQLSQLKKDSYLSEAYADTFAILSKKNSCSSFFGGSRGATIVLNRFIARVKREPLLPELTFKMSGELTYLENSTIGVSYRLFNIATVNSNGAFYQSRGPQRKLPPNIGDFAAGSRPARTLILLHELGHLIRSSKDEWLIPDDGYNGFLSRANTLRIQLACQKELHSLQ